MDKFSKLNNYFNLISSYLSKKLSSDEGFLHFNLRKKIFTMEKWPNFFIVETTKAGTKSMHETYKNSFYSIKVRLKQSFFISYEQHLIKMKRVKCLC